MTRFVQLFLCLIATLFTGAALAQDTATPTDTLPDATSSAPVAYVYVSSYLSKSATHIHGFAAALSGRLTPLPGSPFAAKVISMAVNGKYLFGSDVNGLDVDTYSIASNGTLKEVASLNAQRYNRNGCDGPGPLFLDHTGATLYNLLNVNCFDNTYESLRIEKSSGDLQYLGSSGDDLGFGAPLSFIGDNVYAYATVCSARESEIVGFKRNSDGMLTQLNIDPTLVNCPYFAVADPTNHLAVFVGQYPEFGPPAPSQIAAYTVETNGDLSTKSTTENSPKTEVTNVSDMSMSPSGKLLAVGGSNGLQVFHFNGSNPSTHFTGLITNDPVNQLFWDSNNHLYALSGAKLLVFSITPTSVSEAPGSPYAVANAESMIVQPK
jgi:hypothetical protein